MVCVLQVATVTPPAAAGQELLAEFEGHALKYASQSIKNL